MVSNQFPPVLHTIGKNLAFNWNLSQNDPIVSSVWETKLEKNGAFTFFLTNGQSHNRRNYPIIVNIGQYIPGLNDFCP